MSLNETFQDSILTGDKKRMYSCCITDVKVLEKGFTDSTCFISVVKVRVHVLLFLLNNFHVFVRT